MHFDHQVFVSYAHIDDEAVPTEPFGCVTLLHKTLKVVLDRQLGCKTDFWKDERLEGGMLLTQEITDSLNKSAVMLAVLSKRYVESSSCALELKHFCDAAQRSGGLVVDNHCRVFKVFLMPLSEEESKRQPALAQLNDVLGYEFFEREDGGGVIDLSPAFGPESKAKYLRKVTALASEIARVVSRLQANESTVSHARPEAGPIVYLASVGSDRSAAREDLKSTLQRLGCEVLPDRPLPIDQDEYVEVITGMLQRSAIAVHLVGARGGFVPDGDSAQPEEVLQCRIAAKVAQSHRLERLIWLPEGTKSLRPAQSEFIRCLQEDAQTQQGADLIVGPLESLKEAMEGAIRDQLRPMLAAAASTPGKLKLCLVCCEADRKGLVPLIKYLRGHFEVCLPVFSGSAAEVREANRDILLNADLICLYYGVGDEAWKYHQTNELTRVKAMRSRPSVPVEYVLLAEPTTDDKELLAALADSRTIDLREGISMQVQTTLSGLLDTPVSAQRSSCLSAHAGDQTP